MVCPGYFVPAVKLKLELEEPRSGKATVHGGRDRISGSHMSASESQRACRSRSGLDSVGLENDKCCPIETNNS